MCCQGAAAYPENEDQQQRLREAAEGLRVATNAAAQNAIKKKLINRLEVSDATDQSLMSLFLNHQILRDRITIYQCSWRPFVSGNIQYNISRTSLP